MKYFRKRFIVSVCAFAMGMMLVACGSKDKNTTSSEETIAQQTTEAATELVTETEAATEEIAVTAPPADVFVDDTEDTEDFGGQEDVPVSESGLVTFQGISMILPTGYVYSPDNSSIDAACFISEEAECAFVLCVDANNTVYTESDFDDFFDSQIKGVFGEDVTHGEASYNGHTGAEWNLDSAGEENCGRAFVLLEDKMMIYIEFFGYGDHVADYEAALNTLTF